MTTYYVATDGSSGNNGLSALTPKQTYAQANALATTGDTVLGRGGDVFRELNTIPTDGVSYGAYGGASPILDGADLMSGFADGGSNIWDKGSVTTQPKVVVVNGILGTLKANRAACTAPGDWYWTANTLSVYATSDPSGGIAAAQRDNCILGAFSSDNITLRDLIVRNANNNAIVVNGLNFQVIGGEGYNCSRFAVQFAGTVQTGGLLYGWHGHHNGNSSVTTQSNGTTIAYCIMHDDGWNTAVVGGPAHAIYNFRGTGEGGNHTVVDHCWFYNYTTTNASAIRASGNGLIVQDSLIENCVVGIGPGDYDVVGDCDNHQYIRNVFRNCTTAPIYAEGMVGALIYHNTFIGAGSYGLYCGANGATNCANNTVRNCLFSGLTQHLHLNASQTTGFSCNYNCYDVDGATKFHWAGTDYNFANWKTNSSQDANSLNQDPLLVSGGSVPGDLQSGSPCINAGVSLAGINDGPDQVYGSAPDIGAIEYWPLTRIRRYRSRPRPWRPWR